MFTDYLTAEQIVTLRDQLENEVRRALKIPFNASAPALRYEHSMGQGLPDFIYRMSANNHTTNVSASGHFPSIVPAFLGKAKRQIPFT